MNNNFTWLDLLEPNTKLDLTKDEDYNKVMDLVKDAKNTFNTLGGIGKAFFGDALNTIVDDLEKRAKAIHDESKKPTEPTRPSASTPENIKTNVQALVSEYVNTMIKPYAKNNNLSDAQISKAKDGLFEFACWMYNK